MTPETIKEDPTGRRPTLIGPFSQALTLRGLPRAGALSDQQLEVIHQAGVVISGPSIVAIGPWDDLLTHYSDVEIQRIEKLCEERGLCTNRGFTLTPGLVDAHTHLCFAGSRARDYTDRLNGVSYEEITARGGGIRETMTHTREADINAVFFDETDYEYAYPPQFARLPRGSSVRRVGL